MTIIEMVLSLAAILGAAVLFTNAVEILGERLNLGQGAVGSLLAAVGTALPETMIPIVAIVGAMIAGSGSGAAGEIGIGAILGAPFLLTTLAMLVVGASALVFKGRRESGTKVMVDKETAKRDLVFFIPCFAIAAGAGIVVMPMYIKIPIGIGLLAAYGFYVFKTLEAESGEGEETPDNLMLWPGDSPPTWAVSAQLIVSLAIMGAGAHFFVQAIEHGSKAIGIPAGLIALVLAPLATELPEKFNSVIWMREDKDVLAFGNIAGAMVFQSTIPVTIGILLTKWELNSINTFAVALTLFSSICLYLMLRTDRPLRASLLAGGGALYVLFVVVALVSIL